METPPRLIANHSSTREDEFLSLGNPNYSEETTTRWVSPPTWPFHSDGKSKPFRVGHFYSAIGKSKPLGELQRDGSQPLLGLFTLLRDPAGHSEV